MGETIDPISSSAHESESEGEPNPPFKRQPSESSLCPTEEDEDELNRIQLGPKCSIRDHLEKDKV